MEGLQSFDSMVAGQAAIDAERQPQRQRYTNPTTPNPSQLVSDHSYEGAKPATRPVPKNPPAPPAWVADHDEIFGYAPATADQQSALPHALGVHGTVNHDQDIDPYHSYDWGRNSEQPSRYPLLNIGKPFEAREYRQRHLRTDRWDNTGKIVNPADAPSAPTQIWNSQHHTEPRWLPFAVTPLFQNIGKGPQFSHNPGYLGVSDGMPNSAPRQFGSEVAQMPDDPYVSQGASYGGATVDYGWYF